MPSPEAGEGHHTEGSKDPPPDDFDDSMLDHDLALAAQFASEQHGHSTQATSPFSLNQPMPQPAVRAEVLGSSRTVPTKTADGPSTMIERPRSSGEPASQGFRFGKCKGPPQLDMTRKRGPSAQHINHAEPHLAMRQSHTGKVPVDIKASVQETWTSNTEGEEHPLNDSHYEIPSHAPANAKKARHNMDELPSQTDQNDNTSSAAVRADRPNSQSIPVPSQKTYHISSKQAPSSVPPGGSQIQDQRTKRIVPPAEGNSEKLGLDKFSFASSAARPEPSPSITGRNKAKTPQVPLLSEEPSNSTPWAQFESTGDPSGISEASSSQVPTYVPLHEVKARTKQDVIRMDDDNTLQRTHEHNEQPIDSHLQAQNQVESDPKDHLWRHPQGPSSIRQQATRSIPLDCHNLRGSNNPGSDPDLLHDLNTRIGPTRVTKAGPSTKRSRRTNKATKGATRAGDPVDPPEAESRLHSSHVLGIWQKLFEEEQRELTAREVARRKICEAEITRLHLAEQEHELAINRGETAKQNALAKSQQLQAANKELDERVKELEGSLSTCLHEVKELQREKKAAAKTGSDAEKKIESLKIHKKSLVDARNDERQRASQEISALKIELTEAREKFEGEQKVAQMRDNILNQQAGSLAEAKNREAELERRLKDASAKFGSIEETMKAWTNSLNEPLKEITHSIDKVLEHQAPKCSIEEILATVRTVSALPFVQHSEVDDLRAALLSIDTSIQTKLDDMKESQDSSRQNENSFERRLIDCLQHELMSYASSEEKLTEIQKQNAALEERYRLLEGNKIEMQKELNAAIKAEKAAQSNLIEEQAKLSSLRASLPSVDSTRLQQLEVSKVTLDHELQSALAKVREEEQKSRGLLEVELGLHKEVMELKGQLKDAQDSISKSHAEGSKGGADISKLLETEQEKARLYYARHAREVVGDMQAKYANALRAEQEKGRRAEESLKSQGAQIASLKEQISRKDFELQSRKDPNPAENASVDDLQCQLEAVRSENAEIRKTGTDNNEKIKRLRQQLSDLEKEKHQSHLKYQQEQQANDLTQGQLQASNSQLDELRQQLEEAQTLLRESDQESEKQKSDAEEIIRQRDEYCAAESERMQSELQAMRAQAQESNASHQLQREEYEEQLRSYRQMREEHDPEPYLEKAQQMVPASGDAFRPPARTFPRASRTPAPDAAVPAANSGSVRKPRRKLDRSNKSDSRVVDETQPVHTQMPQSVTNTQTDTEDIQAQTTPRPGEGDFDEDFWVPHELGKHERLTDQGVAFRSPPGEAVMGLPAALQDPLRKPKLFSDLNKEHEARPNDDPFSGSSSAPVTDLDMSEGFPELHLQGGDPAFSSPTPRVRGGEATVKQAEASMEHPSREKERPISRANTSKRVGLSAQLRQGSHSLGSAVADQTSSPLFMSPPNPKTQVTYGRNHPTQMTNAAPNLHTTPSGVVKRRPSGQDDESSNKRPKNTSSMYRSSPIMTRAISRAGSHSQVSESQSQDLRVRFPEALRHTPARAESQQPQATVPKNSHPQSQQSNPISLASRMKSSGGASSSGRGHSSTPKNPRKRKSDEMRSRFDQETDSSH